MCLTSFGRLAHLESLLRLDGPNVCHGVEAAGKRHPLCANCERRLRPDVIQQVFVVHVLLPASHCVPGLLPLAGKPLRVEEIGRQPRRVHSAHVIEQMVSRDYVRNQPAVFILAAGRS